MWKVSHTRTFLRELSRLPQPYRRRVKELALGSEIEVDAFLGGRMDKMKGHVDYYKLRIGVYRIGVQIDEESQEIIFMRVRHRRDIYRYFP